MTYGKTKHALLTLAWTLTLVATTMPIFSGYVMSFVFLIWIVASRADRVWRSEAAMASPLTVEARAIFRPVHWGVAAFVVLQVSSEVLSFAFVDGGSTS